jgi:iron(III) transport system permease protein
MQTNHSPYHDGDQRERALRLGLGALYLLLVLGPLLALLALATQRLLGGQGAWLRLLIPEARRVTLLLRSLLYAAAVSLTALALGLLVASLLWSLRRRPWVQLRWLVLILAPVPPYIHALAWSVILQGGVLITPGGGLAASWFAQSMALLPLAVALALIGLESVERDAIAAACTLRGATPVLVRIVLPLAWPVIAVGGLVLFVLTLLDYTVPSLYGVSTYALEIMVEFSASNEPVRALLYALPLLLLAAVGVLLCRPGLRQVLLRSPSPVREDALLAHAPAWLRALQGLGLIAMALQIGVPLVALLSAMRPWHTAPFVLAASGGEIVHSTAIAGAAALLALPPAYAAAHWLGRRNREGLFWLATALPLAIPPALVGIGLIVLWNRPLPVDLYNSIWMPILASLGRFAPLAALILAGRMARLDRTLLEAARIYQGNRLTIWRRVNLPLMAPALMASAAAIFVLTIGELGATLLVVPPGETTLTIKIYNYLHYGASDAVAALSLFAVLVCLATGALAAGCLMRRRGGGCVIRLEQVDKSYGPVAAVVDAALSVAPGERVAILGPSGSGKTTLMRLIAGLERPDAGEIYLDGRLASAPRQLTPPHLRGIGFAFQAPTLWPHMTVGQNITFGLSSLGRRARQERAQDLLSLMGLQGMGGRYPDQLSGGEARRVGLARALAPRPRYLLLDEPLTYLDTALKTQLMALLSEELDTTGATLLYVTHDETEAACMAARIVRMEQGRLLDGEAL